MATFETVVSFQYRPVFEQLCAYLNEIDMCRMRCVNRIYYQLFSKALMKGRDIEEIMYKYIGSWSSFRRCLRESGGVVTGSVATQFFSKCRWENTDMDIFVRKDRWRILDRYLRLQVGYELTDANNDDSRRRYGGSKVSLDFYFKIETYVFSVSIIRKTESKYSL